MCLTLQEEKFKGKQFFLAQGGEKCKRNGKLWERNLKKQNKDLHVNKASPFFLRCLLNDMIITDLEPQTVTLMFLEMQHEDWTLTF